MILVKKHDFKILSKKLDFRMKIQKLVGNGLQSVMYRGDGIIDQCIITILYIHFYFYKESINAGLQIIDHLMFLYILFVYIKVRLLIL